MFNRRTWLRTAAASLAATATLAAAQADFPSKPVSIVVPGAPGGGGDFTARLLADELGTLLGGTVIVENRAGAAGNIAATHVARAPADGHTLLLAYSGTHVGNPAMFANLQWDPIKSFTPVAMLVTSPQVIVVSKSLPVNTLGELVAYARQNPGKLNYATSGPGTVQHIGTELFAAKTGTRLVHVPYKGAGAALTDVLSGQVQMMITTPPAVVSHIKAGGLKALAIASKQRHPMLPDVPTTAEAGVREVEVDAWFALFAPAGTPAPVVQKLSAAVQKVVTGNRFRQRAEESGTYASYMAPAQLDAFTRAELTTWSDIIKKLGIKAD
jgi:tripartite-type tricarboxylate transporter receptor subunit TctC